MSFQDCQKPSTTSKAINPISGSSAEILITKAPYERILDQMLPSYWLIPTDSKVDAIGSQHSKDLYDFAHVTEVHSLGGIA